VRVVVVTSCRRETLEFDTETRERDPRTAL
jgi:hypothetical protein